MVLSAAQKAGWDKNGYLHLPQFFGEGQKLRAWTDDMSTWPESAGQWMKYFETPQGASAKLLCRMEYIIDFHEGWKSVIFNEELIKILSELFGEPAILFKEKLNFKLPGGQAFTAHQDAPAFASFGQDFHITAMVSIDETTRENGCLEMVAGKHKEGLLEMTEAKVLSQNVIDALTWVPLETSAGDLVLFDSYLPHRSPPNISKAPRRAAYLTYNGKSQGDYRDAYYAHKRKVFPPDIERVPGKDYGDSGLYNIGNPIAQ
jgi:2-aminoethylphosphonate dioxygenase